MSNYYYITEYLPKRYDATAKQEEDREMCYAFKDGTLSSYVKNAFISKANSIIGTDKQNWVVCFIPASTSYKTRNRFSKLAAAFRSEGYNVDDTAIYNEYDKDAEHISGKTSNPIESFGFHDDDVKGKKVLLIDDIITRGRTFSMVADRLKNDGAANVTGLFLAKTIEPDYHPYASDEDYDEPDYYDEPDDYYDPYEEEETYDRYNGTYAQDVEGWSDQDIDTVLDGEPDAYWNLD